MPEQKWCLLVARDAGAAKWAHPPRRYPLIWTGRFWGDFEACHAANAHEFPTKEKAWEFFEDCAAGSGPFFALLWTKEQIDAKLIERTLGSSQEAD